MGHKMNSESAYASKYILHCSQYIVDMICDMLFAIQYGNAIIFIRCGI